jgi:excisionase family DNA binding protein
VLNRPDSAIVYLGIGSTLSQLEKARLDYTASPESFLTVAEVAEMLKLNPQTVRNWIDQGSLPAVRVGRRVRILRSDFDRLVEGGYRSGGTPAARQVGPSAEDFWGGEPVGRAEPGPDEEGDV